MLLIVIAVVAVAGCGATAEKHPRGGSGKPRVQRPPQAVPCPADASPHDAFDARELVAMTEADARKVAERHDCAVVPVRRDDQLFGTTANYDPKRILVEVDGGIVTRLDGVN